MGNQKATFLIRIVRRDLLNQHMPQQDLTHPAQEMLTAGMLSLAVILGAGKEQLFHQWGFLRG